MQHTHAHIPHPSTKRIHSFRKLELLYNMRLTISLAFFFMKGKRNKGRKQKGVRTIILRFQVWGRNFAHTLVYSAKVYVLLCITSGLFFIYNLRLSPLLGTSYPRNNKVCSVMLTPFMWLWNQLLVKEVCSYRELPIRNRHSDWLMLDSQYSVSHAPCFSSCVS